MPYYEESKQDLVKRLSAAIASGSFDKKEVEKMGEFREHKNMIDPKRLAVVAFLQDDATKQVLTATYMVVGFWNHSRGQMMELRPGFMRDTNIWIKATVLGACSCTTFCLAQVPMSLPTDRAGIVALPIAFQEKDEIAFRKTPTVKDPVAQLDMLPDFIRLHPSFFGTKGGVYNAASEFDTYY